MMRKIVRRRGAKTWDGAKGSEFMGSALASLAMSAFATGAGVSGSPAQAAIAPEDALGVVRTYRIPAGPVAAALNDLADENGLHVAFPAGMTQGLRTPGLSGSHSLREALDRLLAGTRLIYALSDNRRTVLITLAQNDTVRNDAGAEPLPPIDIGAERPRRAGDGRNKSGLTPENSYVTPVVSTGTKTDTPVMNTPVNVQSVTEKALTDQQAITLGDALKNISGAYVAGNAAVGSGFLPSGGLFVRGFQSTTHYRDGFRVDSADGATDATADRSLGNVESVEMLKGPGAMAYGLSEPGGVVNITTKGPKDTPHYYAGQQIGSLALYRTSLGASGPATQDKSVLYRVDMTYENNGAPLGYFIDTTHGQNFFVAPVVQWNLSEQTSLKAEVEYTNVLTDLYIPQALLWNGNLMNVPRNVYYGERSPYHTSTIFSALTLTHKFDEDWTFRQRVGFNDTHMSLDAFTPQGVNRTTGVVTRNEITFAGSLTTFSANADLLGHFDTYGLKHTLLLGGDYYRKNYGFDTDQVTLWGTSTINFASPTHPGLPATTTISRLGPLFQLQESTDFFLQDQIDLPYDFHAMAGVRYQRVDQRNLINAIALAPSLNLVIPQPGAWQPLHQDRVTPRFGLAWRPQEWVSLYGNYTEGFGPNAGTAYPNGAVPPGSAFPTCREIARGCSRPMTSRSRA